MVYLVLNGKSFLEGFLLPAILLLCWKKNLLLAAGTL